jgi:hypothetical protein
VVKILNELAVKHFYRQQNNQNPSIMKVFRTGVKSFNTSKVAEKKLNFALDNVIQGFSQSFNIAVDKKAEKQSEIELEFSLDDLTEISKRYIESSKDYIEESKANWEYIESLTEKWSELDMTPQELIKHIEEFSYFMNRWPYGPYPEKIKI